jgi:[acyl-carrier-protein] S-malonyltransferase
MKTALIFPGQGSQYVGMGKDWYDADAASRELFRRADRVLGFSLSAVCFEGPEEELRQTKNTQPAIFLHSVVAFSALRAFGFHMTAGHSLGEYSALVAAGSIEFEDALRLVRLRGELMQAAGEQYPGTMAAVIGLSAKDLEGVCRDASSYGVVQPANYNSPGQVVISGSVAGVRRGMELAKEKGAKLVKELVVSGAFHSPLMESARDGLAKGLKELRIADARVPVFANVTADPVQSAAHIRDLLYRQLTSPVRWEQSVRNMTACGADRFVEVGPGKVLQGLVKRTEGRVTGLGIDRFADLKGIMV